MEKSLASSSEVLSRGGFAKAGSGLFSRESLPNILRLISVGSPLPEILNVFARLVESQGEGLYCTIWLPDEQGNYLYCAAAPSLPGFSDHVGRTEVCPKGASCGTAVYRREAVYVTDILTDEANLAGLQDGEAWYKPASHATAETSRKRLSFDRG